MEKILMIFILAFSCISCEKEEIEIDNCQCGTVLKEHSSDLSVTVRNDCTNNIKRFKLDFFKWSKTYACEHYCFPEQKPW